MGIPKLTVTLAPYAEQRTLPDKTRVAIDGPALAYHVIHICAARSRGNSPFDQPTYDLLGKTAVAWLDELQLRGVVVSVLFFDGYLPESKRPVRMERAWRTSKDFSSYFAAHPSAPPAPNKPRGAAAQQISNIVSASPPTQQRDGGLPPPTFAVQAILESLRRSDRYGPITRLMPGEADVYCAEHVRSHGGTILTSDSDLLVFDLGPEGSVVFFKDIQFGQSSGSKDVTALVYSPAGISTKLSLPAQYGTAALAFELVMDPYVSLNTLLELSKRAAAISSYPEEYRKFTAQYAVGPAESPGAVALQSLSPAGHLAGLDSRVSEVILQCLQLRGTDAASSAAAGILMFLPQLLDSWTRVSAWGISFSLRQLAYAIMQYVVERRISEVTEYARLGSPSSKGRPIELPRLAAVGKLSADLVSLLKEIQGGVSGKPELMWLVLSMYYELQWSKNADKESLVLQILRRETQPDGVLDPASWNAIHLLGQMQGTLYSLSILAQILVFVGRQTEELPESLRELREVLSGLPSFADYPSLKDMQDLPERLRQAGALQLLSSLAGLPEPIQFRSRSSKRKRAASKSKAPRQGAAPSGSMPGNPMSGNPFALLSTE